MKSFSGLRFNNTQLSDQLTALMLVGVTAVIVGGVGHTGMHKRPDPAVAAAPAAGVPVDTAALIMAAPGAAGQMIDLQLPVLALAPVAAMQSLAVSARTLPASQPLLHNAVTSAAQVLGTPERLVRTAELNNGDTLGNLLADADLSKDEIQNILQAIGKVHNLRRLPHGLEVTLKFTRLGNNETFDGLTLQPDALTEINLARQADGGFKAERIATPVMRQRFAVTGTINTTLYEAGAAQGVPRNVMAAMIRAFSHEIDFQRDLHPGNKFRVFYDQPRTKSGQPAGEATIIYAALEIKGVTKSVYRVLYSDGTAEYFNARGESIRRGLMRTPVDGAHMTSSFGMRRHPILGYSKMHQGVDFAASPGTPVFAAGDGVVQEAEYKGGYGRFVLIKHPNGLATAYAHMSRFARGVREGSRVRQGDVIAYVGSSGRSTGPHLHFEVRMNGRPVNPMSVNMRAGRVLSGRSLVQFNQGKARIQSEFTRLAVAAVEQKKVKIAANGQVKLPAAN